MWWFAHGSKRRALAALGFLLLAACGRDPEAHADRGARAISSARIDKNGRWLADDARAGRYYASPEAESTAAFLLRRLRGFDIPATDTAGQLLGERPMAFAHSFSVTLHRLGSRTRLEADEPAEVGRDYMPLLFARDAEIYGPIRRLPPPGDGIVPAGSFAGEVVLVEPGVDPGDAAELQHIAMALEARGASAVLFATPSRRLYGVAATYPSHLGPEQIAAAASMRGTTTNLHPDRLSQASQAQAWREAPRRTLPAALVRSGWAARLRDGDPVRIAVELDPEVSLAENVLVGFRGRSRPKELVVIGAHYDHTGVNAAGDVLNGGDDNASGVAALLDIAAAFEAVHLELERSVLLVFFSAGREGLQGSEVLLQDLSRLLGSDVDPVAMLALRAVGRNGSDPLLVLGGVRHQRLAAALSNADSRARLFGPPLGTKSVSDESTGVGRLEIVPSRGSDHLSFARSGVPSVLVTDGIDPLLFGQPEDDWSLVDADKVARVARLVFHAAYELATAPGAIATTTASSP